MITNNTNYFSRLMGKMYGLVKIQNNFCNIFSRSDRPIGPNGKYTLNMFKNRKKKYEEHINL